MNDNDDASGGRYIAKVPEPLPPQNETPLI
jgi:hypothetical protein